MLGSLERMQPALRQRAGRQVGLEEAAREMVATGVGLKRGQRAALAPFLARRTRTLTRTLPLTRTRTRTRTRTLTLTLTLTLAQARLLAQQAASQARLELMGQELESGRREVTLT